MFEHGKILDQNRSLRWRNAGTLNDDFFARFLNSATLVFCGLYTGGYAWFGQYSGSPTFGICYGGTDDSQLAEVADPFKLLVFCVVTLAIAHGIVLRRERAKLEALHRTADSSGLPRVGDTHVGIHLNSVYATICGVSVGMLLVYVLVLHFRKQGTVAVFPYSIAYIVIMSLPGLLMSLVCPVLMILKCEKLRKFCKRKTRNCSCHFS